MRLLKETTSGKRPEEKTERTGEEVARRDHIDTELGRDAMIYVSF